MDAKGGLSRYILLNITHAETAGGEERKKPLFLGKFVARRTRYGTETDHALNQ
jgi:hypothetical protein